MVGRIAPPAAEALAVTGRFELAGAREALPPLHVLLDEAARADRVM